MRESKTQKKLKTNISNKIFSRTGIISTIRNPILKRKRVSKLQLQRKNLYTDQENGQREIGAAFKSKQILEKV